jgi:flagellar biosynthesis/type III secretory pathway M-ring protein FliF/YscJ
MRKGKKIMVTIVVLVCITLITLTTVFATRPSGSTILFTTTQ